MSFAAEFALLRLKSHGRSETSLATASATGTVPNKAEADTGSPSWSVILIAAFVPIPVTIISAIIIVGLMGVSFAAFKAVFPPTFIIFEVFFSLALFGGILSAASKSGRSISWGAVRTLACGRLASLAFIYIQIAITIAVMQAMVSSEVVAAQTAQIGSADTLDATLLIGASSVLMPIVLRFMEPMLPAKKVEHTHSVKK